jgi:hypothetical protein
MNLFKGSIALHKLTDYFSADYFSKTDHPCDPEFDANGNPVPCDTASGNLGGYGGGDITEGNGPDGWSPAGEENGLGGFRNFSDGSNDFGTGGGGNCTWSIGNTGPCGNSGTTLHSSESCGDGSGPGIFIQVTINCAGVLKSEAKTLTDDCDGCTQAFAGVGVNSEEDRIKNALTGKARCVYDELVKTGINNHNLIRETFIEFGDGNFGNANLIYKQQSPLININGIVLNGASDKIGNDYFVIINSDRINNRAPIEIAKTIIHESLHALLKKHFYTGTESFIELFGKYMQENIGSNDITHAIMRDHYVASISNSLKQFDNNQELQQFYDDLAWEGLHQFLPQADIDRIIQTINTARNRGLNCK